MSNNQTQGASIEAERADFEAAMVNVSLDFRRRSDGRYADPMTTVALLGYRAARRTTAAAAGAGDLPPLDIEDIDLTYAIAGKLGEFYPQETPRDMEKNHRLARAIQRLPLLRKVVEQRIAADRAQRKQAVLQEISDIGQEIEADTQLARIADLACKLSRCYPDTLPGMYVDGEPVGKQLREACAELASRSRAEGGHGVQDAEKSSLTDAQPDQRESAAEAQSEKGDNV